MNVSRRTFLGLSGTAALAVMGLGIVGCQPASGDKPASSSNAPAVKLTAQPEQRDLMGSPDPCEVRVGSVIGPPAMGLSQFIVAAKAGKTINTFNFDFSYAVDYQALTAAFNQGDFDICVMPSNLGPILYNNAELKNEYKVISINNLGVLYMMTTDPSIESLEDVAGKTVFSYGAGGTPEYTINALLKKMGLEGSFNLEFKSSPFEILNLMQEQENCIAILPQPFVSLSKTLVPDLRVPVDITVEWDRAFADTGSQAVTTITCVNKEFLDAHEQAVVEYLNMAGQSVEWTLSHLGDAASLQEELGTFLNNSVALDAMPDLSIVCMTGVPMRTALSGFLEELYKANPASIGGKIPDDEFYYLPPVGVIKNEEAGVAQAQEHKEAEEQDAS